MMLVLAIVMVLCFVINVPIAISLVVATAAALLSSGNSNMMVVPQHMVAGVDSFALLAIPFFMMAGTVMDRGGVSKRIINMADRFVGHIKGGLGDVSIISCAFFAAISGSTPATAAAIGGITIPEMKKRGYPSDYSSAVVAAASCLGVIIPPSIPMVVFGTTAGVSVGKLLLGGFLPGIFLCVILCITNHRLSKKKNFPAGERSSSKERLKATFDAIWALLMPIIIMGGIMSGVFTPTESACVAVVYGIIVGKFVYKELKWSDLIELAYKGALGTSMIMLLIACSKPLGWVLTSQQVPAKISAVVLAFSSNKYVILLLVMVVLLFLGCLMETSSIILLTVPILQPIMQSLGVNMIHFGVICVINLAIGMITPPVGIALFTTAGVSHDKLSSVVRQVWPMLLVMLAGLLVLLFIPEITLFLPNTLMPN